VNNYTADDIQIAYSARSNIPAPSLCDNYHEASAVSL